MEGFVQIVLIDFIQGRLLGSSGRHFGVNHRERESDSSSSPIATEMTEIRTVLQYLIEMLEAMQTKPITLVTYAFLNNTLSKNFDRYLSPILRDSCQGAAAGQSKSGVYDFERRNALNLSRVEGTDEPGSGVKN